MFIHLKSSYKSLILLLLVCQLCGGKEKSKLDDDEMPDLELEDNYGDEEVDLGNEELRQMSRLLLDSNGNVNQDMVTTLKEAYKLMQEIGKADELDEIGFMKELDKLQNMDFSKLGLQKKKEKNMDNKEDSLKFNDEDVEKLKKYYGNIGDDSFFEKTKDLLTDPEKVLDSYRGMNMEDLVSKLADRTGTSLKDLGRIASVSESLEFIIDFYKGAQICEKKLDELFASYKMQKEEETHLKMATGLNGATHDLIKRTEMVIRRFQTKIISSLEYAELLKTLSEEKSNLAQKQVDILEEISKNMTSSDKLKEMENQRQLMFKQTNKLSDMGIQLTNHLMGLKKHIDLLEPRILPVTEKDLDEAMNLKLFLFEELLGKHQKLEGLKNQILLEKNLKTKEEMERKVKLKEDYEIPEFVLEHGSQLNKYMVAAMGIIRRNMTKMLNLDMMIRDIRKAQDAFALSQQDLVKSMRKINDMIEEAVEDFLMKDRKVEL